MQTLQPRESALKQGLVSVCASQERLVRQLLKPLESLQRLPKENPVGDDGVKARREEHNSEETTDEAICSLASSA